MTLERDTIEQHLPFITVLTYGGNEYIGIIINQDAHVTGFYDYNLIKLPEERSRFLELGETWWWESNRKIPISIFLKQDIQEFYYIIRTFATRDVKIVMGPVVNLSDLLEKRVKRRSVQLIRRVR